MSNGIELIDMDFLVKKSTTILHFFISSEKRMLGDGLSGKDGKWSFHSEVASVFDGHVRKSVPGYDIAHSMVLDLAGSFLGIGSLAYDLGCSTGTLLGGLADRYGNLDIQLVGVDEVPEMLSEARKKFQLNSDIELICDNLSAIEMQKCDMVSAMYTIQFIRPAIRQIVINKIYDNLNWGGGFFLFEKIRGADGRFQDLFTDWYYEFKSRQGFSADEILNKRNSLRFVMEPFSYQGNVEMLERAGFKDINTIFQVGPFQGFLCIK